MSKNILMVCQYASPNEYGFGSRHFHLGREFAKSGNEFTILISSYNHLLHTRKRMKSLLFEKETIENIKVVWLRTFQYKNHRGLTRVINWFWFSLLTFIYMFNEYRNKIDVTIVSSPSPVAFMGAWLGSLCHKSKIIFEIRDIWPLTFIHVGKVSPTHPLMLALGWIEKFAYKKADMITSTLPNANSHIKSIIGDNFKFKCIPQGIDPILLKEIIVSEQYIKIFQKNKFNVVYAGTLTPSNNLSHFIRSICLFQERGHDDFHFYILGSGVEETELKRQAKGLSNLTFIPRVPKEDVKSLLGYADVLFDSTLPGELYSFGLSKNKWIDYMLVGKPIIASYSGFVSMINEADCGVIVPADDDEQLVSTILQFKNFPSEKLSAMGMRGKEFVLRNRTFKKLAGEYETLF